MALANPRWPSMALAIRVVVTLCMGSPLGMDIGMISGTGSGSAMDYWYCVFSYQRHVYCLLRFSLVLLLDKLT